MISRRLSSWTVVAMVCMFGWALFASTESYDVFTERITSDLADHNPEAADAFREANAARDREDYSEAERLYKTVLNLEPGFVHATRRLCYVILRQERRGEALPLCREALEVEKSAENMAAMIFAILGGEETEPNRTEVQEALSLGYSILKHPDADANSVVASCQAALAGQDLNLLEGCVPELRRTAPDEVYTHYFGWVLAMSQKDHAGAIAELDRAHELGLPDDTYIELRRTTDEARPIWVRYLPAAAWTAGIWIAGFLVLLILGAVLSGITLRAARRPPAVRSGESVGLAATLRRAYRAVLWVACVYYYISIPLVLIVVIILGGGIIYSFFVLGRVPVKLVAIVAGLMLITLWAALKSFFVRARDEDPGDLLKTEAHPRLAKVLEEVAGEIGTRPVDNVYMTPGTDLAVTERGGFLRQIRGATERCLILGVGVLEGMKIAPFKAILAHEYGHFSNRDTAGGGFALSVRRSLLTMAQSLAEGGAAAWYNPAWIFLNGFYRLFLRISQGASRLQEVLADRWAAFAYGAANFERGLRHVIERAIRFDAHANIALQEAIHDGKAMSNLYTYAPDLTLEEEKFVQAVQEAITARPSPYDSHPCPRDRFELVHALQAEGSGDLSDGDGAAWSLFDDRAAIEVWMTDRVRDNVRASHGVEIKAEG